MQGRCKEHRVAIECFIASPFINPSLADQILELNVEMKTEGNAAGGYYATAIGEIFIHSCAKSSEYMLALFHQP